MLTNDKTCSLCKAPALRAWYRAFPMWLCGNEQCNHVWGFWSWILNLHFDGQFAVQKEEDPNLYAVAEQAWKSGKPQLGTVDEHGNLTIKEVSKPCF